MRRAAVGVVALVVISGVLGACGGPPANQDSASATQTPSRASSAPIGPNSSAPAPAEPGNRTIINITVRGGQVSITTGTGQVVVETARVTVPLGNPTTVAVTSDKADVVHVHGYDKEAQIPAGGTGSVSFVANIPGVFEVELHGSGQQLLQLQVS